MGRWPADWYFAAGSWGSDCQLTSGGSSGLARGKIRPSGGSSQQAREGIRRLASWRRCRLDSGGIRWLARCGSRRLAGVGSRWMARGGSSSVACGEQRRRWRRSNWAGGNEVIHWMAAAAAKVVSRLVREFAGWLVGDVVGLIVE